MVSGNRRERRSHLYVREHPRQSRVTTQEEKVYNDIGELGIGSG